MPRVFILDLSPKFHPLMIKHLAPHTYSPYSAILLEGVLLFLGRGVYYEGLGMERNVEDQGAICSREVLGSCR